MKNLQCILKIFHEDKEIELNGILPRTRLTKEEILECLTFLNTHHLISTTSTDQNAPPRYKLCEDFNRKWLEMKPSKLKED